MTIADQLVALANDYISSEVKLSALDEFIHAHVDESLSLEKTGRPEALLFGFLQVRLYEMRDGVTEDEIRQDLAQYLGEHDLLRRSTRQRATG